MKNKTDKKERKMIKDFKIILKDFEPMVREPVKWLLNGRDIPNFSLRPREAWANWLLCVVLRKIHGEHITFAEDIKYDGIIVNKNTGELIITEHVSALENVHNPQPKGEERVINAINKKIEKGSEYAKNKWLIVFFDGAEKFYRNKIRESIKGKHNFGAVYCIGLLNSGENGYSYSVTEFKESSSDRSVTFKVDINADFTDWCIEQIKF